MQINIGPSHWGSKKGNTCIIRISQVSLPLHPTIEVVDASRILLMANLLLLKKIEQNVVQHSNFMINIEIDKSIIVSFSSMILDSSFKNSSMNCVYHGQYVLTWVDKFFIIIMSLSKLLIPNLWHLRLINILTILKIHFVSIWDPRISKIYQTTIEMFRNRVS